MITKCVTWEIKSRWCYGAQWTMVLEILYLNSSEFLLPLVRERHNMMQRGFLWCPKCFFKLSSLWMFSVPQLLGVLFIQFPQSLQCLKALQPLRDMEFAKCVIITVKARQISVITQGFGSVYEQKINKHYTDEHSVCTEVKGVRDTLKTNAAAEKFSTNHLCPSSGLPQVPFTLCEDKLYCKYQHLLLLNCGASTDLKLKKTKHIRDTSFTITSNHREPCSAWDNILFSIL